MKKIKMFIQMIVLLLLLNASFTYANQEIELNDEENFETELVNILTYEEAAEKAINYSYKLKNQLKELEKLEEQRETAGRELSYGGDDEIHFSRIKKVKSLDASIQMAKKEIDISKESITFETKNAMNDVNKLLNDKKLEELNLQDTKAKLDAAMAKFQRGTISAYELKNQQEASEKKLKELEMLGKSIEAAYLKLNTLLGIKNSEEYILEETVIYEPLEEVNINLLVSRVMSNNPSIWNQEKKIEMAELDLVLHVYNVGGDSYDTKKINISVEKNNLATLKISLEESIRNTYNQIQQTEKSYEILADNLKSAENTLEILHAQYNGGVAISSQLQEVELQIVQLKNDIKNKAMDHEKQKELLYKPYL